MIVPDPDLNSSDIHKPDHPSKILPRLVTSKSLPRQLFLVETIAAAKSARLYHSAW